MKKLSLIAVLSAGIMIIGCGGSSSSSSNNSNENSKNSQVKQVKVVDGYVIGANVCDQNGTCATTDSEGMAKAAFSDTILTAKGGYIDVDNNGEINSSIDIELPNNFSIKTTAGKSVITPITDLLANNVDADKLSKILGISKEELYADPIETNNTKLEKAIQIVYAVKIDGKENDFIKKLNSYDFNNTLSNENTNANNNNNEVNLYLPKVESTANNVKGSVELFAKIALEVVDDNVKQFINKIIECNCSTPVEVEKSLVNDKKDITSLFESNKVKENKETNETQPSNSNSTSSTQVYLPM